MLNFEYYTPTKVVFGKDTEKQAGELVKAFGGTKVLVHFGGQSAKKSGLLDRICNSLEEAGLSYVTLGGVVPNPHLSTPSFLHSSMPSYTLDRWCRSKSPSVQGI